MDRFLLIKNGKVIGRFKNEKSARISFLNVCEKSDYATDVVRLVDLDLDGNIIAEY